MNKLALFFTIFLTLAITACNKDADNTATTTEAVAPAMETGAAAPATEGSSTGQDDEQKKAAEGK
ncbi:MAG: hypothetical protein OEX12_09530 [Gammaproteobacteria bacterium]|nr:hypothetical protein [Gammaproteobacteria bacterium]